MAVWVFSCLKTLQMCWQAFKQPVAILGTSQFSFLFHSALRASSLRALVAVVPGGRWAGSIALMAINPHPHPYASKDHLASPTSSPVLRPISLPID